MARISKSDLVEMVSKEMNVPATVARRFVGLTFDIVESELRHGNEVAIQDFGTFKSVHTPARTMNDTLHGKGVIQIPARRKAKFVPSKNLLS